MRVRGHGNLHGHVRGDVRGDVRSDLNSDANGDANGDFNVDEIDLAAWEFQYGTMIALVGLMVDGMAVPEPTTWALACLAFSGWLTRGRRKLSLGDP